MEKYTLYIILLIIVIILALSVISIIVAAFMRNRWNKEKFEPGLQVSVYKQPNYVDFSNNFVIGEYPTIQNSIPISSLKISNGLKIQLYKDENFQNYLNTYMNDVSELPEGEKANVRSIKIISTN